MKARRPLVRCVQARLGRATRLRRHARGLAFAQRRRLALAWRRGPRAAAAGAAGAAVAVRHDTRIACRVDWRPAHAHVAAATPPTRVRTGVACVRERVRLASRADAIASRRVVGWPDPRANAMARRPPAADARFPDAHVRARMRVAGAPGAASPRVGSVEAPPTTLRIGRPQAPGASAMQGKARRASPAVARAFAPALAMRTMHAVDLPGAPMARPRARPVELTWARVGDREAQATGGPASPFARTPSRATATPAVVPTAANTRAAVAEALRQQAGAAPIALDRAATDRIADEVMRRVDKQLRIERERRGR